MGIESESGLRTSLLFAQKPGKTVRRIGPLALSPVIVNIVKYVYILVPSYWRHTSTLPVQHLYGIHVTIRFIPALIPLNLYTLFESHYQSFLFFPAPSSHSFSALPSHSYLESQIHGWISKKNDSNNLSFYKHNTGECGGVGLNVQKKKGYRLLEKDAKQKSIAFFDPSPPRRSILLHLYKRENACVCTFSRHFRLTAYCKKGDDVRIIY